MAFKHLIAPDFIRDLHVKFHLGTFSAGESQGTMSISLALCGENTPLHPFICCLPWNTFFHPMAASNLTIGQAWQGLPWHDRQYREKNLEESLVKCRSKLFFPSYQRIWRTNDWESNIKFPCQTSSFMFLLIVKYPRYSMNHFLLRYRRMFIWSFLQVSMRHYPCCFWPCLSYHFFL